MSIASSDTAPHGLEDAPYSERNSLWPKTDWDKVLALRDPAAYEEALADICQTYHGVFLCVLRRWNAENAEDLTQEFILSLLRENPLARTDLCQGKGRFRQYVSAMLKNFARKQHRREQSQRRGGGAEHVQLTKDVATTDTVSVEMFDREWARALVDRVVEIFKEKGTEPKILSYALKELLMEGTEPADASYAELATSLGKPEASLRSEVARARKRFVDRLRQEVALTTVRSEVEEELRYVLRALAAY